MLKRADSFFTGEFFNIFSENSKNQDSCNYSQDQTNFSCTNICQKINHTLIPLRFSSIEMKSNNKKNNQYRQNYTCFINNLIQLIQSHLNFLSERIAKYSDIAELYKGIVKNSAAAIFTKNPEYTLNAPLENNNLNIKFYYNTNKL